MAEHDIYLNHAGTSWPKPQAVVDAVKAAMVRAPSEWGGDFNEAHHLIAAFFGIQNAEQLLLTPGCTSSLAVGLGDIDLGGRKRVLTSTWEHHALHRPLLKLKSADVAVAYVGASHDSPFDLNRLEDELSAQDVGLVAMTAAANVTGDLLPVEGAIELAHRHGAQVLIDAAQVVGWLDLNLVTLGADLVAFGGHKGLQGPWGIGGLYIGDSARMKCGDGKYRPGYCDVGSVDQVALAGLRAALGWLEENHRSRQLARGREQIRLIESALEDAGARCVRFREPTQRMPTIAFSVSGQSSTEFADSLKKSAITVGCGLQCAPLAHQTLGSETAGLVRISVGIEQSTSEIEAAIETLMALIAS
ncbi:MAG: aminotransferase class V-fold PLP-dependent enzyme [Pseudomonadota bacterium]